MLQGVVWKAVLAGKHYLSYMKIHLVCMVHKLSCMKINLSCKTNRAFLFPIDHLIGEERGGGMVILPELY